MFAEITDYDLAIRVLHDLEIFLFIVILASLCKLVLFFGPLCVGDFFKINRGQ